ncbi:MAG TPA: alpha/beta hydrolase [Streptosporangiaceae bacterium]|nr:alpha/beta hydrolase [Streptosporangiaceae bacterium]
MPTFRSADGTELAYHVHGRGSPLVCVPGGPMRASSYLGDLGGLAESRQLVLLDLRGTGQSAVPADRTSYRCVRLVDDVRALQDHLGLPNIDLLGHSAGANIVVQFAERHPDRVAKLVLACPSTRAVGLEIDSQMRRSVMQLRQHEPWFAEAAAAFERIQVDGGSPDDWTAIAPMLYGRWDAAAQADYAGNDSETNDDAAKEFGADGAFDPPATRAALSGFGSPVLLLAGEVDLNTVPQVAAEFAQLFPHAKFVVQPGAGHSPWLDDPAWFSSAVRAFLDEGRP